MPSNLTPPPTHSGDKSTYQRWHFPHCTLKFVLTRSLLVPSNNLSANDHQHEHRAPPLPPQTSQSTSRATYLCVLKARPNDTPLGPSESNLSADDHHCEQHCPLPPQPQTSPPTSCGTSTSAAPRSSPASSSPSRVCRRRCSHHYTTAPLGG